MTSDEIEKLLEPEMDQFEKALVGIIGFQADNKMLKRTINVDGDPNGYDDTDVQAMWAGWSLAVIWAAGVREVQD